MPKKIDPDMKAKAVRLVTEHLGEYPSLTAAADAVAKQLGFGGETVRRWVVQSQIDAGARAGTSTEESEQVKKLKAENKRLREANEILKAASIFFAGELDPRNR
jgi:transposase-like protein